MNDLFEKSKEVARYFGLLPKDIVDKGDELLGTLGLDSLTLSHIRGLMEPKPTYQVLSGLTINQILEKINISNGEVKASESRNLESFEFSLTPIQESYFMGALQSKPCQIYTEIDVKEINIDALKKSINKVVKRHPMLRAKIADSGLQTIREDSGSDIHIEYYESPNSIRESCIEKLRSNPELYWDIQLSKVDAETTRLHIIIDMIFIDAMSAMQLCKEVSDEYNNMLVGEPTGFYNKSRLNFVDYCESIKERKPSRETMSFWESKLSKLPNSPNLPITTEVTSNETLFEREAFTLKTEYWELLKDISVTEDISPNSLIIAIFSDVLRLYSENEDFTLAITKSNRPVDSRQNFMGVVGNFTDVTLCPIIDRYKQNVISKAKEVNGFLRESMEHDDISGIDIIKMVKDYYKDQHINFPVVFTSFLGIFESNIQLNGKEFSLNYQRTQTPQISLDCQIYENNNGLVVNWDYDNEIYSTNLIRIMINEMENLMIKLTSNHSDKAEIPMESIDLINQINDTSYDFANAKFNVLHGLIEDNERKYRIKTALIDQEYTFSYGEMIKLSRMLAGKLQQKGVKPGAHVPIILKKGWEQVVSALAVLMAGGVFVPLNHKDPEKRLNETVKSLNSKIVISNEVSVSLNSLLRHNEEFEFLNITYDKINSFEHNSYNPVRVEGDQLAYIIFTSGSTGKPKGVEISHNSALNTCLDINKKFSISDDAIAFGISAFNFDLSIWDIFGVLSAGGTLVICSDDKVRDPDYWWDQIQKHNINIWNTVPTTFEMLLTAYSEDKRSHLELALLSGDAIRFSLVEKAQEIFPKLKIVGLGGATEASIWSNYHIYSATSKKLGSKLLPYGKPLANQQIYVLDKNLKCRPQNVVGDIYIGGNGLAKGYFNNEKLTQNCFVNSDRFGRLYKTGDLGRYLNNGEIEILGRRDMQMKIGGHRIELGEIEKRVQTMENIIKVNVIATNTDTGYLVGFVVVKRHTGNEEIEIKEYLEKYLPTYMIPQMWIILDDMPNTSNGKVDIKKLKAIVQDKTFKDSNQKYTDTSNNNNLILDKVSELLGISPHKINMSKSLFEQGLTSLHAVKLVNTLSDMWNTKLPYSLLFNNPSVEKLMEYYEEKGSVETQFKNSDDRGSDDYIAVISSACRLPGSVKSTDELWDMLLERKDCITKVPTSRFDIDTIYNPNRDLVNSTYTNKGAFIDSAEYFDYDFFSVPVAEAKAMDPQQRILLEVLYEACYKGGYGKSELNGSDTGVFIGQMNYDWMTNFSFNKEYAGTGVSPSITSNRISYILNLVGPSMTIDTACSSSLVAVDNAVSSLLSNSCSMAIAGGVNLILSKEPYITTCKAGMLSVDGRCATFDSKANGIARGEGVGVVVLKRLEDAKRDGDNIISVIKGTAVNQDGKSASLTIPNGYAQENVINKALNRANVRGNDIDYIECHGTGTPLGDPIEVEAIKNTLGKNRDYPLVLGSIKTNIGHLEGAAGIVGLIKTIEVLKHKIAPGNVHFNELNPKISFDDFNAVISSNNINIGLKKDSILASVSSFGYGGTNAHVILESWNNEDRSISKSLPDIEESIFNSKPLPWNKQYVKPEIQENIIKEHVYETNWELMNSSK
ncbi:amino acid adenylation domain-containing protein, partial [Staphylococcus saprophyticus]